MDIIPTSFETLNEDEVHYFCYRYETIEYLQEIFNRNIECELAILCDYLLFPINRTTVSLEYEIGDEYYTQGIIVKLKKDELNKLIEIDNNIHNNSYIMNNKKIVIIYINQRYYTINCYLFISKISSGESNNKEFYDNITKEINISNDNILIDREKIFLSCHNLLKLKLNQCNISIPIKPQIHINDIANKYFIYWNEITLYSRSEIYTCSINKLISKKINKIKEYYY